MTWLDALLLVLWAAMAALGYARALLGLAWGALGLALWGAAALLLPLALNTGAPGAALLPLATLLLAGLLLWWLTPWLEEPFPRPWQHWAGGLGGAALGGVLVLALSLGLPLGGRAESNYPSDALPLELRVAVSNSLLMQRAQTLVNRSEAARRYLVPDLWVARRTSSPPAPSPPAPSPPAAPLSP